MPRTLLLADDSVTIQKVVGLSFASEDVVLVTVSNGDDAIARAREISPHLVLADVVMPGRNGYEVCEAIKSDPALRHVPVLLLTGTFEAFDQERARRAGADGHVTKPFEAQALVQQVMDLMSRPAPVAAETGAAVASGAGSAAAFDVPTIPPAPAGFDDPFFEDPAPPQELVAEPLGIDADAAVGELELATVAEDDLDDDDLFGATDLAPVDAETVFAAPAPSPFQTTPTGGTAFSSVPSTGGTTFAAPAPAAVAEIFEVGRGASAAFRPPFADTTDTDALSPRAMAPPPAPLPPDEDDLDFGLDDAPELPTASAFTAPGESRSFGAPPDISFAGFPAHPARAASHETGREDASTETVVAAPRPPADLAFADLDDPLGPDLFGGDAPRQADEDFGDDDTPVPFAPREVPLTAPFAPGENPLAAPFTPREALAASHDVRASTLPPEPAPAAGRSGAGLSVDLSPVLRERLHDTLEKIAWEAFADLSDTIVRQALERIETIAWEVIPQMAEQLVREEIRRMKGESGE